MRRITVRVGCLIVGMICSGHLGCGGEESAHSPEVIAEEVDLDLGSPGTGNGGTPENSNEGTGELVDLGGAENEGSPGQPVETDTPGGEENSSGDEGGGGSETEPSELPPCEASGMGFATLLGGLDGDTLLTYEEGVDVAALHQEPGGCYTLISLTWKRAAGCELKLTFSPSVDGGVWMLDQATLSPGVECGAGGTGVGTATLSGVPDVSAISPPPLRCTVLWNPVFAHGAVAIEGEDTLQMTLELDGLGVDGMLLSNAVEEGNCGFSYTPCDGQECGQDPLLDLECGGCSENSVCDSGVCTSVEPIVAVCTRVIADREDLSEGTWTGSTNSCEPGAMSLDWQERALKISNLYRWLAGQPPLALNVEANPGLQECATMMHAWGGLSHNPSESWPCFTSAGSGGAGSSNLATLPAVGAVDLYMADPGNATTIGHRRWILSDWINTTAFGSTSSYSCMQVVAGWGGGLKSWIAWPPPDYYPMEMHYVAYQTVDSTGWTIQTNGISIQDATAEVKENGVVKPIETMLLLGNYGSSGALKITPNGWKTQVNSVYEVKVIGASEPIEYSFQTVDCSELLAQQP